MISFFNEKRIDNKSLADRGLMFADGVFETMRVQDGQIPLFNYHLQRVLSSCQNLAIEIDKQAIESNILTVLSEFKCSESITNAGVKRLKLIVTRGSVGVGCYTAENFGGNSQANVIVSVADYTVLNSPVELVCSDIPLIEHPKLVGKKHLNRLNYILACEGMALVENQHALLVDQQDFIVESMHHNVFFYKDGDLFTPNLQRAGVEGVMKKHLIESVFPALSIKLHEVDLHKNTLHQYTGAFVSNALNGVSLVEDIDGHILDDESFNSMFDSIFKMVDERFAK